MSDNVYAVRDAPRQPGPRPAAVDVDPYDSDTYLRFVATAAVDLLGSHLGYRTRSEIARHGFKPSLAPPNLAAQLARRQGPTSEFLGKLEKQYLYRKHPLHNGAPWLTSFQEDLIRASKYERETGAGRGHASVPDVGGASRHQPVRIPIGWFFNLATHSPRNSTEAFVQGHALKAFLADARQVAADASREGGAAESAEETIEDLLRGFGLTDKATWTIADLLEVVAGPPHTGLPAVRLLASFGELAFGQVQDFICHDHPAGFRGMRVLGRILSDPRTPANLRRQVGPLLRKIHEEEPLDPYPARSLLVEALRFAPRHDPEWNWVTSVLMERAESPDRPTRERVYAAYVLFNRENYAEARKVEEAFSGSADDGLSYAGAFLGLLFERKDVPSVRPPYPWPHARPEHAIVDGATKFLDDDDGVPYAVRGALRKMVQGALLTIDGTARRSICEAIQAAGLGSSAVKGLSSVVSDRASPPWLVEHAAFIIGYLQTGHAAGVGMAIATLVPLAEDETQLPPVRHAALWGIGDVVGSLSSVDLLARDWPEAVAGSTGGEAEASVERRLTDVVDRCSQPGLAPQVRWAATYAAAMLARRCECVFSEPRPTVVSQTLERLVADADPLVQRLADWGQRIVSARQENSYLPRPRGGSSRARPTPAAPRARS